MKKKTERQGRKILIVAGEASGDTHAAKLVGALRELAPETGFFGATGPKMRKAGVETVVRSDEFAVVGLLEIGKVLPMFWRAYRKLAREAVARGAEAAILVDFPDFNLKLAKTLKRRGLKIVYYISPQLWAWRRYRVGAVRRYVDLMLTILPFEKEWYAGRGVSGVRYVGSPTVREVHPGLSRSEFRAKYQLEEAAPLVALLPGSRHKEIARILPVMLEAAAAMSEKNRSVQFVVALAAGRKREEVDAALAALDRKGGRRPARLVVVQGETHEAVSAADAAAVTSGTATLETAILGTPLVIVYKTSPLNYKLLRPLISVEHFGLVNLIAGERVAQELIQEDFTAGSLATEIFRLLEPQTNREMRDRLKAVVETLGRGGASRRAAEFILEELQN